MKCKCTTTGSGISQCNKSFFKRDVISVQPTTTLGEVASKMHEHNVGAIVVVDEQRPVGLITDRDLALALGCQGLGASSSVQKVMSCPVTTMKEQGGVLRATELIEKGVARRLPVVDEDGRLVGLVTADDLLLLLIQELSNVSEGIRPEVAAR